MRTPKRYVVVSREELRALAHLNAETFPSQLRAQAHRNADEDADTKWKEGMSYPVTPEGVALLEKFRGTTVVPRTLREMTAPAQPAA